MRRAIAGLLCAVLLVCSARAAGPGRSALAPSAASAVLVDADSGRVLFEKNAHEQRLIASITKLMTALVAVEHEPDLSKIVTVKKEWLAGAEGSSLYLAPGDQLSLEALLYGMLLQSGNDAAQVVAGYCAGDVAAFVEWMNLRASDLGMVDSHFANPSGLNAEGHYSTAYDMALCAVACMDDETVARMMSTKRISFGERTFVNHNKLLDLYEGCVGGKTGYTQRAGRTLVSCAQRDGQRLVAVTLGDPDDWKEHMALFDYGFSAYERRELCVQGETVRTLPVSDSLVRFTEVVPATGFSYPLAAGEELSVFMDLPDQVAAPVRMGQTAGQMEFYLGQTRVGSVSLVYARSAAVDLFQRQPLLRHLLGLAQRTGGWPLGRLLKLGRSG